MTYKDKILDNVSEYPQMPSLCQSVLEHLDDPEVNYKELELKVQFDPGLTANILRLANSAYFGAMRSVDSLHSAFVRLGTRRIFELIISNIAAPLMKYPLSGYDLRPEDLLRHSVWVGVASGELAKVLGINISNLQFTAGLLHDMGKLILDPYVTSERGVLLDQETLKGFSFEQREHQVLGLDHAEVGAKIMDQWQLPYEIVAAVRWHHEPSQALEYQNEVDIVHIADILAYAEGVGTGIDGLSYNVSTEAQKRLGLRKKDIEYAASITLEKMEELERILNLV